ncbi:hypothetical protein Tco_0884193 [Tanacetum coccineum]
MLHPAIRARLVETHTMVSGFSGEQVKPLWKIELDVCFSGSGLCRRAIMEFTIIPAPSPYNIILGRPGIKQLRAIPSTIHGMMKYDQGAIKNLQALSQRQPIGDTGQSKEKGILLRKNPSDSQGSGQMAKSRDSQACEVPHLDFKPSHVQESRRKLEDVHRLQEHQYRMSKRLLPATGDRHQDRVGHGFPTQVFSGCI